MNARTEVAIHIRDINWEARVETWLDNLLQYYPSDEMDRQQFESPSPAISRIYVGDEFCSLRLPTLRELKDYASSASDTGLGLTLLVPILTDHEQERLMPLFEYLASHPPDAEVVAGDPGTLIWLKNTFPSISVSAGRLFDRGFKDPRVQSGPESMQEGENTLQESAFDNPEFQDLLASLGARRLERDLLPCQATIPGADPLVPVSVYFPFGYFTTGRICWISTFDRKNGEKFLPMDHCQKACRDLTLTTHSDTTSKIMQNGNTFFYLYDPSALAMLFSNRDKHRYRYVYQGLAMGAS